MTNCWATCPASSAPGGVSSESTRSSIPTLIFAIPSGKAQALEDNEASRKNTSTREHCGKIRVADYTLYYGEKVMPYAIRPAAAVDVPQLAEIEMDGFPTNWPPTPFKRDLSNKMISILVACDSSNGVQPPLAAQQGQPVRGDEPKTSGLEALWGRLRELFPSGASPGTPSYYDPQFLAGYVASWFMTDEAHITGIAVRELLRGNGLGELLLIASIEQALRHQSSVVTLEVRVSNDVAQSLYTKYGFNRVGRRKGYYTDNHEDAYIMTTDPITSPEYATRYRSLVETYTARRGNVALVLG